MIMSQQLDRPYRDRLVRSLTAPARNGPFDRGAHRTRPRAGASDPLPDHRRGRGDPQRGWPAGHRRAPPLFGNLSPDQLDLLGTLLDLVLDRAADHRNSAI